MGYSCSRRLGKCALQEASRNFNIPAPPRALKKVTLWRRCGQMCFSPKAPCIVLALPEAAFVRIQGSRGPALGPPKKMRAPRALRRWSQKSICGACGFPLGAKRAPKGAPKGSKGSTKGRPNVFVRTLARNPLFSHLWEPFGLHCDPIWFKLCSF